MALPHPLKFVDDDRDDMQLDVQVLLVSSEGAASMSASKGFRRVSEYEYEENESRASEDIPRDPTWSFIFMFMFIPLLLLFMLAALDIIADIAINVLLMIAWFYELCIRRADCIVLAM